MLDQAQGLPAGEWLDVNGVRTKYYDRGSGETIVFIYGGNFGTGDFRLERLHVEFEFRSAGEKLSRRMLRQTRAGVHGQSAGRRLHDGGRGASCPRIHPSAERSARASGRAFARRLRRGAVGAGRPRDREVASPSSTVEHSAPGSAPTRSFCRDRRFRAAAASACDGFTRTTASRPRS